MKNKVKQLLIIILALWLIIGWIVDSQNKSSEIIVKAQEKVDTFSKLKTALESNIQKNIILTKDIILSEKIYVNGIKSIDGNGYGIIRQGTARKSYQGTMLYIGKTGKFKAKLKLKNITISGNTENPYVKDNMQGRILEIFQSGSSVVLEAGCILEGNCNTQRKLDGGGAVTVNSGTQLIMEEGSVICNNKSVTGGAAVRICEGGSFFMKGGNIRKNAVYARSEEGEYQGLGGAIHNRGKVILMGGRIYENEACNPEQEEGAGLGGAIYNLSDLKIEGTTIDHNCSFSGGGGIYATDGSKVTMKQGAVFGNDTVPSMGGGFYINNGSLFELQGGEIYGNAAGTGAGIYISKKESKLYMTSGYIFANYAYNSGKKTGGGVRNNGAYVKIEGGGIGMNETGEEIGNYTPNASPGHYGSAICNSGYMEIRDGMIRSMNYEGFPVINTGVIQYDNKRPKGFWGTGKIAVVNEGEMIVGANETASIGSEFEIGIKNTGVLKVLRNSTIKGKHFGIVSEGKCMIYDGKIIASEKAVRAEKGTIQMGGKNECQTIFLGKNVSLQTEDEIECGMTEIEPVDYFEDRLLVKPLNKGQDICKLYNMFQLMEHPGYYMKQKEDGLYVGVKRYGVEFHANGGVGVMEQLSVLIGQQVALPKNQFSREGYQFIGWSRKKILNAAKKDVEFANQETVNLSEKNGEIVKLYALWVKKPVIEFTVDDIKIYEGENIKKEYLSPYIKAVDFKDGDLSSHVCLDKIVYSNGNKVLLPTKVNTGEKNIGIALATYSVKNSEGITASKEMKIFILPNEKPQIQVKSRYFFLEEVDGMSKEEFETDIKKYIVIKDDVESREDLLENLTIGFPEKDFRKEGKYNFLVTVKDQYGHRFYMKKGEKYQYGMGKTKMAPLYVYVVKKHSESQKNKRYVRFLSEEFMKTLSKHSKWKKESLYSRLQKQFEFRGKESFVCQNWHFSREDIQKAKDWIYNVENPFLQVNNEKFYLFLKKRNCCIFERG